MCRTNECMEKAVSKMERLSSLLEEWTNSDTRFTSAAREALSGEYRYVQCFVNGIEDVDLLERLYNICTDVYFSYKHWGAKSDVWHSRMTTVQSAINAIKTEITSVHFTLLSNKGNEAKTGRFFGTIRNKDITYIMLLDGTEEDDNLTVHVVNMNCYFIREITTKHKISADITKTFVKEQAQYARREVIAIAKELEFQLTIDQPTYKVVMDSKLADSVTSGIRTS